MKAIISLNGNSIEANFSQEDALFLFTKQTLLNDIQDSIDELDEKIYGYIETDECLVELQGQVEGLELKYDRLYRANNFKSLKRLGYDVTLVK